MKHTLARSLFAAALLLTAGTAPAAPVVQFDCIA